MFKAGDVVTIREGLTENTNQEYIISVVSLFDDRMLYSLRNYQLGRYWSADELVATTKPNHYGVRYCAGDRVIVSATGQIDTIQRVCATRLGIQYTLMYDHQLREQHELTLVNYSLF